MTLCTYCKAGNVIRLNPLETIPQFKCLNSRCKKVFIPQADRIKLMRAIRVSKPHLRDINADTFNEICFEFWCATVPGFARFYARMLDETPNILELLTSATTIDRDGRRKFEGNDEGLNATFKADNQRLEKALTE